MELADLSPSSRKRCAIANPRPLVPPVMTTYETDGTAWLWGAKASLHVDASGSM